MKVIATSLFGLILLQNLPVNADCIAPDPQVIDNVHNQKKLLMNVGGTQKGIVFNKVEKVTPVVAATPGKCTYTATVTFTVDQ